MSGMTNPAKVVNFIDITRIWNPSLAFVMGGTVIVTYIGYRIVLGRTKPVFGVPKNNKLDGHLIVGACIFGVGWEIAGFGPKGHCLHWGH